MLIVYNCMIASFTVPSLTTLVACLSFTGKNLKEIKTEYDALCGQKENVASLKYEEILEIAQTAIPKKLGIEYDSLNPTQQLQVLSAEIDHRCKLKKKELNDMLFIIENTIFVLWRHLEFYLQKDSITTANIISPCERRFDNDEVVLLQQSLFQTSPTVVSQLKASCQQNLEPVLEKLGSIPVIQSSTLLPQMYKRLRSCYNL
ncbi:MAG: hypothetical protein EXX96DRAFT_110386 [Benjaminiella poitrasii]|nr:MAG: hypothetical protein EXX96DRAFT_110386 [Benjaminiella poitrasii]